MNVRTSEQTASVALTAPSARTVAIVAQAWRDDAGEWQASAEVLPVAAIEVSTVRRWSTTNPHAREHLTPRTMAQAGWELEGVATRRDLLVVDPELGLTALLDLVWMADDEAVARPVVCTWPPSKDGKNLIEHIEAAKTEAIRKVKLAERRASTRPAKAEAPAA